MKTLLFFSVERLNPRIAPLEATMRTTNKDETTGGPNIGTSFKDLNLNSTTRALLKASSCHGTQKQYQVYFKQ